MSTLYQDLPLTNFPSDGVDTFPTYLNVTATDGPLIQQYMEAMNAGNQVLANQILAQIPAAEQKVIKATDLNKVMQATLAVERFYKDDIYDYIAQEQQNWENIINQFTYKGIYSSGNTYQKYNMVGYATNGSTLVYIAIQDVPTGNAPLNETFWRVMTIQGQEGEPGVGLSYRLKWNPATQYEPNQAVTYDGILWMALQTNINVQPGTNDSIWEKVLDFTVTTYPIQPTQPTNLPVGGLWFNTEGNPTQYYYLTPLQSPASADEIGAGYQAYDSEGNMIMGTATFDTLEANLVAAKAEAHNSEVTVEDVPDTRTIMEIKVEKISNSKKELESYLQSHPIQWTDGKFYSITREKQQQLTSKLFAASAAKQASTEYELKWNSTGDECVEWTLEELFKLAFYIDSHVTALVSYQQALEKQINACQTAEEIESIVIDYDSVK